MGMLLPWHWGVRDRALLQVLRAPALALVGLIVLPWLAWLAVRARSADPLAATAGAEEPMLSTGNLMPCRSRAPVVALAGLEPGSGVTTLAFNLAVALVAHGHVSSQEEVRLPRPACLLVEGPLTEALRLSPEPLEEYVGRHPYQVGAELVNLADRHPSGCELFCLAAEGRSRESLRLLVPELTRHYDAVLVDGGSGERQLVDVATDLGDALLLVAMPTAASVESAGLWIERIWSLGLESKTALLLNRVTAWPRPPRELSLAFLYQAQLPDEPTVLALDQDGLPWSTDGRLRLAARLGDLVRQLFPTLVPAGGLHAA
jgi:hypothetical protein